MAYLEGVVCEALGRLAVSVFIRDWFVALSLAKVAVAKLVEVPLLAETPRPARLGSMNMLELSTSWLRAPDGLCGVVTVMVVSECGRPDMDV